MFRNTLLSVAAAVIIALPVPVASAYEVPNVIVLERPANNPKLGLWINSVTFPHGFHALRVPCKKCHHKETDKTLGEFVGCRQCHSDPDPKEKTGFFRAWHTDGPPSCLGCHTQMRARGGKNPVGCTSACHRPK